jgi:hypothetical protein
MKFLTGTVKTVVVVALVVAAFVAGLLVPFALKKWGPNSGWKQQYAYSLGTQAVIYGFPWVANATVRHKWVTDPVDPKFVPYSPVNHFWNAPQLMTAAYQDGGSPNNDTLYSVAWFDVGKEPLILVVPDIPDDRYYSFELMSFDGDNFAYAGTRTTGQKGKNYAILGPDWHGTLPPDVQPLPPSRTPAGLILGRTLVEGPSDVPAAQKIMAQYRLIPLSYWGKPDAELPADTNVWAPQDAKANPLNFFRTMNRAMTENPPLDKRDQVLLNMFSAIGVGPNQDVDTMDAETKAGLVRAVVNGLTLMNKMTLEGRGKTIDGWVFPPKDVGRAGLHEDFLTRGGFQSMAGLITNDAAEGTYINTTKDVNGEPLSGAKKYVLHFDPNNWPPVKAFWSITLYQNYNLVANPINRYSIGNRTPGLKKDTDGGLTIYIQNESPGADKESNWLPAPKGNMLVVMRNYIKEQPIIDQTWVPPGITPAK